MAKDLEPLEVQLWIDGMSNRLTFQDRATSAKTSGETSLKDENSLWCVCNPLRIYVVCIHPIRPDFGEPTSEPILQGRLADYWSPKKFRGRCWREA